MGDPVEQAVAVEELSPAALEPFGELIAPEVVDRSAAPVQAGGHQMAELGLAIDGTPALFVIRYPAQEMVLTRFERHLTMTEGRVALDAPAVLVVAAPAPGESPADRPAANSIRAFVIRPGVGLLLHRGTWHGLSCFPVNAPYSSFAFLSEVQAELELRDSDQVPKRTELFDFANQGLAFRVTDPGGVL